MGIILDENSTVERKPNRYKAPAAPARAKTNGPKGPVPPTFSGEPCCQVDCCHHRTNLSWYKKTLKISFKQSQPYRNVATVV